MFILFRKEVIILFIGTGMLKIPVFAFLFSAFWKTDSYKYKNDSLCIEDAEDAYLRMVCILSLIHI